jgi:hypothetical protein
VNLPKPCHPARYRIAQQPVEKGFGTPVMANLVDAKRRFRRITAYCSLKTADSEVGRYNFQQAVSPLSHDPARYLMTQPAIS